MDELVLSNYLERAYTYGGYGNMIDRSPYRFRHIQLVLGTAGCFIAPSVWPCLTRGTPGKPPTRLRAAPGPDPSQSHYLPPSVHIEWRQGRSIYCFHTPFYYEKQCDPSRQVTAKSDPPESSRGTPLRFGDNSRLS